MAERCDNCRYWLAGRGMADQVKANGDSAFGWCRRNPPRIVEHVASMSIRGPAFGNQIESNDAADVFAVSDATLFPAIFGTSWCGEWRGSGEEMPFPC
ncbi:hypothetical protein [Sphingomonas nostoxanthinifaciens]|uniref:hypothetical protein n=1 Tax=Sphingomonas nostoxanthinifaciens TaxID=2872652 RepID=UPI001CC1C561|nr:hypothetical protein [Sphingomonas nostoxanthinifaciens]UAK25845.1 hypothetical protein K8P63_06900 [Sphingomonas nostoxanthinifaciens]